MPAREAQRLAQGRAGEAHRDDRLGQEDEDHESRVFIAAEREGHDRDEDQCAEGRGLGDVEPLRHPGAEAIGPIEIERAERDAPHDQDRNELQRVVPERRDVGHVHQMKADPVRQDPADRDQAEIAAERQVLDDPRMGLQHAGLARNSFQRAVM